MISDDLNHEHFAVQAFAKAARQHLRQNRNLNIESVIECTDGCGPQYKCCHSFLDLCHVADSEDIKITRSYFGPHHGKSKCDGEGAVIKTAIRKAVQSLDVTITNAKEMVDFFSKKYNKEGSLHSLGHNARTVLLVNDITRENAVATTVQGTRQFFCVEGKKNKSIMVRKLSCFCEQCLQEPAGKCSNTAYVEPFSSKTIRTQEELATGNGLESAEENDQTPNQREAIPSSSENVVGVSKKRKSVAALKPTTAAKRNVSKEPASVCKQSATSARKQHGSAGPSKELPTSSNTGARKRKSASALDPTGTTKAKRSARQQASKKTVSVCKQSSTSSKKQHGSSKACKANVKTAGPSKGLPTSSNTRVRKRKSATSLEPTTTAKHINSAGKQPDSAKVKQTGGPRKSKAPLR